MSMMAEQSLNFRSPDFSPNNNIPARYTCDGDDISPRLSWRWPGARVASYVLIVDNPDAPGGTFTHWVIYDIPPAVTDLPENVPREGALQNGACQSINDAGSYGYVGPCPPPGRPHRYRFHLYGLGKKLDLPPGAKKDEVLRAMKGNVLTEAEIVGYYGR